MSHDNSNSNVRRCGQIGEEDDDHVSMIDVLNEQARLQADADAVLGDSDEYNCTYPKGYLKRQALYACATCTPSGNAGICLACSYACHEGHDIHELYTKRAFKCDCGNEKFNGNQCQLYKDQKDLNSRNRYNQNFRGIYCTCSRPYPDDDDPVEDEMIQCIMCEDWYHGRHLKTTVPDSDDYHEMICSGCMCKFSFLWAYHAQSAALVSVSKHVEEEADTKVDVVSVSASPKVKEQKSESELPDGQKLQPDMKSMSTNGESEIKSSSSSSPGKRKLSDTNGNEVSASKKARCCDEQPHTSSAMSDCKGSSEGDQCLLKSLQQRVLNYPEHATFWSEGWRSKLCRCPQCLEMYHDRGIDYLLDDTDTMQAYEERGSQAKRDSVADEEADAAALAGMNRVQQIEVVRGVMDLKTQLNNFLQDFAREGKVVKESDIREFFQRMDQRRKDGLRLPQPNCR